MARARKWALNWESTLIRGGRGHIVYDSRFFSILFFWGGLGQTNILIDWNLGYLFRESRMTTPPMILSFYSSKANTNVSNIAGFLCLLQKLLATWNLRWVSCRFSLLKLHLDFELLFLPKMCKILSVRHMTHPQHRFTKYYVCQVFNRITECDCVWRIPWWIIRVSEFLVEIHLFFLMSIE